MDEKAPITQTCARALAASLRPGSAHALIRSQQLQPWIRAPKSHQQLLDVGLVNLATDGKQDLALATEIGRAVIKELLLAAGEGGVVMQIPKARLQMALFSLQAAERDRTRELARVSTESRDGTGTP